MPVSPCSPFAPDAPAGPVGPEKIVMYKSECICF